MSIIDAFTDTEVLETQIRWRGYEPIGQNGQSTFYTLPPEISWHDVDMIVVDLRIDLKYGLGILAAGASIADFGDPKSERTLYVQAPDIRLGFSPIMELNFTDVPEGHIIILQR